MAVITNTFVEDTSATVTDNINFLSPLCFRFIMNRAPNLEYFCQAAALPSISMNEILQPNPVGALPRFGDRITYEPFNLRFRVDEDMNNYLEIHNWLVSIGHPEKLAQFNDVKEKLSDGSILILTSNSNPHIRVAFEDMFPLSLTPLQFDVTQTDIEYLEAEVVFRYRKFSIEKL